MQWQYRVGAIVLGVCGSLALAGLAWATLAALVENIGWGWILSLGTIAVIIILAKTVKLKPDQRNLARVDLRTMDSLDGYEFERIVADLLRSTGYSNVQRTTGGGDFGADILATKGGIRYAIQCKRYSGNVGVKALQEAIGARDYYRCDKAMVITNSYFTKSAIKFAKGTNCVIFDRDVLKRLCK